MIGYEFCRESTVVAYSSWEIDCTKRLKKNEMKKRRTIILQIFHVYTITQLKRYIFFALTLFALIMSSRVYPQTKKFLVTRE